ncbi:MAG: hypothetical protein HC841_09665 [Verrucomicrobiae bacterium]|nr:hypothetical protein [Verrucomicrobiae bacterium]
MPNTFRLGPLVSALLILASFGAHAQPTTFAYEGFLTIQGAPANGTHDFEFKLYDAATLGSQQGLTITVDDLSVSNGLFTVPLDFGGAPFDGSPRWLGIAVRPGESTGAYTNLEPRMAFLSTPYAIRAANFSGTVNAAQLTGTIAPANIAAGGISTVMLATGAVGANQLAAGAVGTAQLAGAR